MYQASFNDGLVYNVSITLNALNKGSPSPSAERNGIHLKPSKNSSVPAFHTTDSGSNPSSCNSSTPSSPTTMRYTPSPANTQNLTTFTFPGKQINTGGGKKVSFICFVSVKNMVDKLGESKLCSSCIVNTGTFFRELYRLNLSCFFFRNCRAQCQWWCFRKRLLSVQ